VHVTVVFPGATKTNITANSDIGTPTESKNDPGKDFPMLPAEEAAEIIISAIKKNKSMVFTGKDSKFMNILYRLNPVFATNFIAKQMRSLLK
jgi:short-subunit dehydrogenase